MENAVLKQLKQTPNHPVLKTISAEDRRSMIDVLVRSINEVKARTKKWNAKCRKPYDLKATALPASLKHHVHGIFTGVTHLLSENGDVSELEKYILNTCKVTITDEDPEIFGEHCKSLHINYARIYYGNDLC